MWRGSIIVPWLGAAFAAPGRSARVWRTHARGALGGLLLLAPALALAEAPKPQDFAYGLPVMASEVASAYRVSLSLEVYRDSARGDLGDLRVFNAGGEAVAYAILRRVEPSTPPATAPLPLFPLHGDARAALDGLKVTLNAAPAGTPPNPPPDARPGAVEQYVLDGRPMDAPVAYLTLAWPEHSADFSGRMRVETSDDFSEWRTVVPSAPLANLHALGQELIENRIDIGGVHAKFWRLTWLGAKPPFDLSGVHASVQSGTPLTDWSTVFVKGVPSDSGKGEYLFDLGAALPVERLNLSLPDTNTMYMTELSSRAHPQDAWVPVTRAGVYRLTNADGEQSNGPVSVHVTRDRYWRARIIGAGTVPASLRLEATWSPPDIEFLAQGKPPFLLAVGSAEVRGAESDLGILPTSTSVVRATLGPRSVLGGPSRLGDGPTDWHRTVPLALLMAACGALAIWLRRSMRRARPGTR